MSTPFLAQAQTPPTVSYVDNEFVALRFSGFSTSSVTTLERIAPDQVVVATRADALSQVVRDTGLTPGITYTYRTRLFIPQNGSSVTSAPVNVVAGEVQGTLDQSMTWEGTRLLRQQVTVPTNVTLSIAPSAVVELRTNFSGAGGLEVFGRLEARGARFHNSTNNPDGFGFRITSGGNSAPPFGTMLMSNCLFRQCFIAASHGLEWGGNTTDLTNDTTLLQWQEVPPGHVLAGENWPGLRLELTPTGAFTASNCVLGALRLEPSVATAALAVRDLTFTRRGEEPGQFEVQLLRHSTLVAQRLAARSNEFYTMRLQDSFGAGTNTPALQLLDCTGFSKVNFAAVTNALVARCRTTPPGAFTNFSASFRTDVGLEFDSCQAVLIRDNRLQGTHSGFSSRGVFFRFSRDCVVFGNDIRGYTKAVALGDTSAGNLITSNVCQLNGVSVEFSVNAAGPATNNLLANNIFTSGGSAVTFIHGVPFDYANFWSFPTNPGPNIKGGPLLGGNFWGARFFGNDTNGDGLSDLAFNLATNHVDLHPLMPDTNLVVNLADDRPDASPDDNEADVDLEEPGLQTTLRAALATAQPRPGTKRIVFDLGSATPQMPPFVITVTNGVLPNLISDTVVDARTQPNRVLLDGTNRPNASGLRATGGCNQILGLWFRNWGAAGVTLDTLSFSNVIQQCRFGIDPATPPTTNVSLGSHGLVVQGIGHLIGGLSFNDGNEFGNARQFGLQLFGSASVANQHHRVLNNLVGFTLRGGFPEAQPNRGGGVELRAGQFIRLGEPDAGNFIAGNSGSGVLVNNGSGGFARDNFIQGNDIGFISEALASDPLNLITNTGNGIEFGSAVSNTVVGATLAEALAAGAARSPAGNDIAFNGGAGIRMSSVTSRANAWRHNQIHDNRNLGLDLGGFNVTTNNNSDGFQNFPVFDPGQSELGRQVAGFLISDPGDYRLEFYGSRLPDPTYFGEGAVYLGSLALTIPPGANSNRFVFPLTADFRDFVSATATDAAGHSSEFSRVFGPLIVNLETDEADPHLADGIPDVDPDRPGLQTTLRCALQNADLDPGRDLIRFVVPRVRITVNLAAAHPVVVDGEFNGASVVVNCAMSQPIVLAGAETELRKLSFFQEGGPPFAARTVVHLLGAHRAKVQGCFFFDCDLRVTGSSNVELGGAAAGQGNEFTFREHDGRVLLEGALTTGAKIFGNTFAVQFPNTPTLELADAPGNFIGAPGPTPGAGAGNGFGTSGAACILLRGAGCRDNRIQGNRFGLAEGGDNAGVGVSVRDGAHDNLIGGETPAERNAFEFLRLAVGVSDTGGERNAILGNLYAACTSAIDLGGDGLTLNAVPAATTGPNRRQNFPDFTRKNYHELVELRGELRGRPHTSHRLELYAAGPPFSTVASRRHAIGSPFQLLGVVPNVTTDASGLALWTFTPTPAFLTAPVVATATDSEGNTSEFSPVFQEYIVNSTGDDGAHRPGDGDPRVNAGEGFPVVTLRSALQASDFLQAPARVVFLFETPTRISLTNALPAVDTALQFDNTPNDIVTTPVPVTLAGPGASGAAFAGLTFREAAAGSSVRGLGLLGFNGSGLVFFGESNLVEGCRIGSVAGFGGANQHSGIELHSSFNRIGGALRNFIGGNVSNGIALFNPQVPGGLERVTGNQVINCVIGLSEGNEAAPNGVGVRLEHASGNLIGRRPGQPASFGRNFITGNPTGVLITGAGASNNAVTGTLFGETLSGFQSVDSQRGVHIVNAPRNRIGGASVDENFFVSSTDAALVIEGDAARANEIFGNEIGRPRLFFPTQPVNARGVVVLDAVETRIGHAAAEFGNFIGNCSGSALELLGQARGTVVAGNFIGVRDTGAAASNHAAAIVIDVASTSPASHGNTIGFLGAGALAANHIAHNARGIVVRRGQGQRITGNAIHHNGGPGVDLGGDGVTPNTPDPVDFLSPNHFQDFPEITNVVGTANALFVAGRIRSGGGTLRFEFYDNAACHGSGFGEGMALLAGVTHPTVAGLNEFQFQLPGPRSRWHFLTATVTDNFGNTSEFGHCLAVPATDAADSDGDGIPDAVENGGFRTADLNNDGIPDALQSHVAQTPAGEGGGSIVILGEGGQQLRIEAVTSDPNRPDHDNPPSPNSPFNPTSPPPMQVRFPQGVIQMSVSNLTSTGRARTRIIIETNSDVNGYWVYAPGGPDTNDWSRFLDTAPQPGASLLLSNAFSHLGVTHSQFIISLNLQDGAHGDTDGQTNGVIHHVGGPTLESFAFRNFGFSGFNPPGLSVSLELPAVPGRRYTVERSSNLFNWVPVVAHTNAPPNVTITVHDTNAAPLFFRAREE